MFKWICIAWLDYIYGAMEADSRTKKGHWEHDDLFTFRAWSQNCSLDGVGLEASLERVVPQSYYPVLSPSHEALQGHY